MSNGIIEYHVEVDGTKVTIVLVVADAMSANRLADALTDRFRNGTMNEIISGEKPDE